MDNSSDLRIYAFYYKKGAVLKTDSVYVPVLAGSALYPNLINILGDNTGENISDKNTWYSELTGIFWVWKNTQNEITGSCHYRRYFTAQPEPFFYKIKRSLYFLAGLYKKRFGLIYTSNIKLFESRILNRKEIDTILQKYDAILPQPRKLKYTVREHYSRYHNQEDLDLLKIILEEKHPVYLEAFYEVMNSKRLYANNMFILKNEHFQEFMSWWFDVLFEFEKRIDLKNYPDYQKRIIGFIAERLLNVWFMKKQLKSIELQVIYFKKFKSEK